MVVIACTIPGCKFKTQDVSELIAIALLGNHTVGHTTSLQNPSSLAPVRGPKLERPTIDTGMSIEEWNIFVRRWEVFKTGSGIDKASAPSQLFQCAGGDLGNRLLKTNPCITSEALSALLAAMHSLAAKPCCNMCPTHRTVTVAPRARQGILGICSQGTRESRDLRFQCKVGVQGRASVDYTDHVIRDLLLNGVSDPDNSKDELGMKDILTKLINDVIAFVETEEMARNALPSVSLSSISTISR